MQTPVGLTTDTRPVIILDMQAIFPSGFTLQVQPQSLPNTIEAIDYVMRLGFPFHDG